MKNTEYVIWGASGHAKVLEDILTREGSKITALFDNMKDISSPWPDIPLYYGREGFESWITTRKPNNLPAAAIAIGGDRGRDRCEIADIFLSAGLTLPPIIHHRSVCASSVVLHEGTQLLAGAVAGPEVILERCVILNTGSTVDHECHLSEGVHIAPGATLCGCIEVGANTLIGPGSVIVPRIKIGSNTIIGSGSVVTRDIGDNVVAWGSPAKVVKRKSM